MSHKPILSLAAYLFLFAVVLPGCEEGDTIRLSDGTVASRSDAIAAPVSESWTEDQRSINNGSTEDLDGYRNFPNTDGSSILAWVFGDDGEEYLSFALLSAKRRRRCPGDRSRQLRF